MATVQSPGVDMAGATRGYLGDFKLNTKGYARGMIGEPVTLPFHLSHEISAVSMTIRWFKETECIYMYKNGQMIERGSEGRLTLNTQELEKGNVSLILKDYRETHDGYYICQVTHGEQEVEAAVRLYNRACLPFHSTESALLRVVNDVLLTTDKVRATAEHHLRDEKPEKETRRIKSSRQLERQLDMQELQKLILDREDLHTQVQKLTVQLKKRESVLEQTMISLEEKDQQLKESNKLTTETSKTLKHQNTQLGSSTTKQMLTKIKIQEAEKCLKTVRAEFIDRVSEPILNSLMDRLLYKKVINDEEMESVRVKLERSEKARGIIDMVRKKGNNASSEMIDILEQLDPNLSEQLHECYSTYQEAEAQAKEIIQRDSEDRKQKEEQEMMERFEKELKESLREKDETILELTEKISEVEYQLTELKKQMREERDEENKRDLEQKLRKESERKEEMRRKVDMVIFQRENEKREMEERHRQEIKKMPEAFGGEARVEAERYLIKVLLPEIFSSIMISKTTMQREFERQLEEKNREIKELEERQKLEFSNSARTRPNPTQPDPTFLGLNPRMYANWSGQVKPRDL